MIFSLDYFRERDLLIVIIGIIVSSPSSHTQNGPSKFENGLVGGYNVNYFLEEPWLIVIFPCMYPI